MAAGQRPILFKGWMSVFVNLNRRRWRRFFSLTELSVKSLCCRKITSAWLLTPCHRRIIEWHKRKLADCRAHCYVRQSANFFCFPAGPGLPWLSFSARFSAACREFIHLYPVHSVDIVFSEAERLFPFLVAYRVSEAHVVFPGMYVLKMREIGRASCRERV